MKRKRISALILAFITVFLASASITVPEAQAESNTETDYVELSGTWHFKTYRTYNRMFQYQANSQVTWEDPDTALLPSRSDFSSWETVESPYPSEDTGGLLPLTRDDGSEFFSNWSEAWFCKTFELSSDFTDDDYVTLLLGIIDDNDVVYINGQLVQASGFIDENGDPTDQIPAIGGFNHTDTSQPIVRFGSSYWEVEREYEIPSNVLNLGGTNTIAIRVYNNNGNGGFYSNRTYGLCGSEKALRRAKGLPTDKVESEDLEDFVAKQITAIQEGDITAYSDTIYEKYNHNGSSRADKINEAQSYIDEYTRIEITDTNQGYYTISDNVYYYSANRTMTGVKKSNSAATTIMDQEPITSYYIFEEGSLYERGNWNRCYKNTYESGLFGQELQYGVYLPPSYFENPEKEYPVVYLLHGINSSSTSFMDVDRIDQKMDQWITNGDIVEMIVIMPDSGTNSGYRDSEYDPDNHNSTGPWRTHITSEIRAQAEENFRIIKDVKFRGITGISMGGGGAFSIGPLNPNLYSSVASHMGALGSAVSSLETLTDSQLAQYDFYLDCGLQDIMVDYRHTVAVHEWLEEKGIEHGYDLRDGGHNSAFYMAGMPYSMQMHSDHFIKNGLLDEDLPEPQYIEQTLVDEATGITVSGLILENTILKVAVPEANPLLTSLLADQEELVRIYSIELIGSEEITYQDELEVTFVNLSSYQDDIIRILWTDDTETSVLPTNSNNGSAKISTAKLGTFGIAVTGKPAETPQEDPKEAPKDPGNGSGSTQGPGTNKGGVGRSPKTGDPTVTAALFGLLLCAAGAAIASKKKRVFN